MPITDSQNATNFQPQPSPTGSTVFTTAPSSRKSPAKNIVSSGVLIVVLAGLILGFGKARSFLSKAEGSCAPTNLQETNLTPNSMEITFQTEKACLTQVTYGVSSESLFLTIPEETAVLNHRLKLSPLLPSTTYYYQIMAEGKKVGIVRSFLTKIAEVSEQTPTLVPKTASYAFEDFQKQYGTANAEFDLDKNGIVNSSDWLYSQKSSQ